jgi:hypothetical protein
LFRLHAEGEVGLMSRSEEEKLEHKIGMARTTNASLANEVEAMGGAVDLATARVEFLTSWLVEQGVITNLQRLEEQLKWEQGLKPQLVRTRDALKERLQAQVAARRAEIERHRTRMEAEGIPVGPDDDSKPKLIIPGR